MVGIIKLGKVNWNVVSNLTPICPPMGQFRSVLDMSG